MKISSLQMKNFCAFHDVTLALKDYTCLVGPNGSGKSTVLGALNTFFREENNTPINLNQLSEEDFHQRNTADPIEITLTFKNLSGEAQKDFADYCRQGQLVVSAVATSNAASGKAEMKQQGHRLGLRVFQGFFRAVGDKKAAPELRELYDEIRTTYGDLPPPGAKDAMVAALHKYEAERREQCELIPSEDQFYGFSKGANRLAKYIQWVYVPAVKDVTKEQVEARDMVLGKLLARTVRSKINFSDSITDLRNKTREQYQRVLDESRMSSMKFLDHFGPS
jgi:putative ATP-dependent endonuclease of the OLD family